MSRTSYVEIDLPVCTLTYGNSPCTASVGVTGERKCFNTRATCQDISNYDEDTSVLRLSTSSLSNDPDIVAIPSISAIDYTPPRIQLAEGIGARSVITVTVKDHAFPDTGPGGDKYVSERSYNPFKVGSFWGKFRARYRFMRGKRLTWLTGDSMQPLANYERREFVIDRIEGPGSDGFVRIIAKDPLSLLDDKRARAPQVTRGSLATAVTTGTTLNLTPVGIVADEYNLTTPYFVNIGGEEVASVNSVNTGTDQLSVTRGVFRTGTQDHDEGSRVQVCLRYVTTKPHIIIQDLMQTYGNIDSSYIKIADWASEIENFLDTDVLANYSGIITDPTPVKDIVNEIAEQSGISLWWDDIRQTVQLQVLRLVPVIRAAYDDDVMVRGTFQQKEQPEKRVSEAWVYFDQVNPLERESPSNYREALVQTSLLSTERFGVPSARQVFSRWIPAGGGGVAGKITQNLLARFADPPRMFSFRLLRELSARNGSSPQLGEAVNVESFEYQDETGAPDVATCQITSMKATDTHWDITAEEITRSDVDPIQADSTVYPVIIATSNVGTYNMRTAFNSIWSAGDLGNGDIVRFEVRSGVVLRGAPAIETGVWSDITASITIQLVISNGAFIVGTGGRGGDGFAFINIRGTSDFGSSITTNGRNGALGMRITTATTIINNGVIGGGGGGGGGALSFEFFRDDARTLFRKGAGSAGSGAAALGAMRTLGISVTNPDDTRYIQNNGGQGTIEEGGTQRTASWGGYTATGGKGGDLGQAGQNGAASGPVDATVDTGTGGAAGNAVDGDSLITWTTLGDIRGNRVG